MKNTAVLVSASLLLFTACTGGEAKYPTGFDRTTTNGDIYGKRQSIFGDNGFCIGGSEQRKYMSESAPSLFVKAKISLAAAVYNAEAATKAKAFDAYVNRDSNEPVYIVKLVRNGKVITSRVSMRSGAVLK